MVLLLLLLDMLNFGVRRLRLDIGMELLLLMLHIGSSLGSLLLLMMLRGGMMLFNVSINYLMLHVSRYLQSLLLLMLEQKAQYV